ncbi:MAG: redoxin domain-containing protein [Verrucomicrobia bacterium]|nr:redoxin domain-containing protein [Verrucomicrobiota bacterium]
MKGFNTTTSHIGSIAAIAGLALGLAISPPIAQGQIQADRDKATRARVQTATNLDGIDLTDTTEDPAYAEAGEALAKDASIGVVGTAAPTARVTTIDDDSIDLSLLYGHKPVYLKFWATWCTPCRQQMPSFEKVYKTLGDKMQVVAVNIGLSDDEASVRAFRDKFGLTMPIVIDDGSLAKLFHVNVTPQHVLIGKDARFRYFGHADNKELEDALHKAVEESDPTTPATPAAVEIESAVREGDVVPNLFVTLLTGETASLKAKPGRILAVQLFSSWCEWYLETSRPETSKACTRARETIESLKDSLPEVDWIGIAGGPWATQQDLADYQKNYHVTIPLALDEKDTLFRTFGIRDIPTIALIDDSQRLVRLIGPTETDLTAAIQAAVADITAAD